jgi:hypothetical protein
MKNVEKELRALDELYNIRVISPEDSVLHKTKAQMD